MAERDLCDGETPGHPAGALTRRAMAGSIAALSVAPLAAPSGARAAAVDAGRVLRVLKTFVRPGGVSAAVALPDGRVLAAAAGADERRGSLTPDTPLAAGAAARTFCAVLVMTLVEDGRLDLDAPLQPLFGDEAWFARLPNAPDLTLRTLLANREGFPDWRGHPEVQIALDRARRTGRSLAWSPREMLAFVADRAPVAPAGTAFRPSEPAYDLVGVALEKATGQGYYDLVRERVLSRLPGVTARPAVGREIDPHAARPAYAVGGLNLTAKDLAGFHWRLARGDLVSAASLAEMRRTDPGDPRSGIAYGLGLAVAKGADGRTRSGHFGSGFAPTAEAAHCAGSGITFAVQTCAPSGPRRLDALQGAVLAAIRA